MKTKLTFFLGLLSAALCLSVRAQGTAFTYQGRLNDGVGPANGNYDLTFIVWNAAAGGAQAGETLTNANTVVSNGLFTVTLDFGPGGVFGGPNRWLEIGVRTNGGGAFTTLSPRQRVTASPYAITAGTVTGVISSSGLQGTYSGALTLDNATNSFSGDGAALTSLNASALTSGTIPTVALSNAWKIGGNTGTTPGTHFLGTLDNQPLELRVNNLRALRLESTASNDTVNVVGGSPRNFVAPGVVGATIGGGGTGNYLGSAYSNSVSADFAFIGSGLRNSIAASATSGAIVGGEANDLGTGATYGFIGAGFNNNIGASSSDSTIAGGRINDIGFNSSFSAIGGGFDNNIDSTGSVIAGGLANDIAGNSFRSAITGGRDNNIAANSAYSFIGGGESNNVTANASYATIPGGQANSATNYAFAAGRRAKANHTGAFVWADSQNVDFESSGTNQFLIRASGGVGINKTNPAAALDVNGMIAATSFIGDASGLTLSTNVALRNATNIFSATQIINGNLGLGTNAPTARLHVNGQVRITGGSPGAGKVLTSDANGTAVWSAPKVGPQGVVVDAAGNGDYTSVSAALAAIAPTASTPYVIEVQPGLYFDRIIMKSHVQLRGAGADSTIIMFNPAGAVSDADLAVVKFNTLTNVAISGLTLTTSAYTNAAGNVCVGIFDIGSSPLVTACRFVKIPGNSPVFSFPNNVFGIASLASASVIRDCRFEADAALDAISLFQASSSISDNFFTNHWHAVLLTQSSAQILNNRMGGLGEAVLIDGVTSEATVAFNRITGISGGARAIRNEGEARIIGNEINGSHEFGIDNAGEATILGNTLTGCTLNGIRQTAGARTTISGNVLLNCGGFGERALALFNSSAVVVGNTFFGSPFGDITVAGAGSATVNNNRTTGAASGPATLAGHGAATITTGTATSNLLLNAVGGVDVSADLDVGGNVGIAGNLGIGTAAPLAPLDARGNVSIGDGLAVVALNTSNLLNLQVGMSTNGAANGISFVENTTGFAMKFGYDGTGGGAENKLVIYDSANIGRFVFENGGNLGLGTNNPAFPIHHSSGAHLTAAGVWSSVSDRNAKKDFKPINPRNVLERLSALPITEWKYKVEAGARHIGPMAQDFYAAFGLGSGATTITTVDAAGVALAAIKGLNEKVEEQRAELKQKQTEITELRQRLEALENIVRNPGGL